MLPVLGMRIVWPAAPELLAVLAMAPAFIIVQYALFLATLREVAKLRMLRREIPRWRLLTGTPPKGFAVTPAAEECTGRQFSGRAMALIVAVSALALVYAFFRFDWNGLVALAGFFWAFLALYQFTFSPDNH